MPSLETVLEPPHADSTRALAFSRIVPGLMFALLVSVAVYSEHLPMKSHQNTKLRDG